MKTFPENSSDTCTDSVFPKSTRRRENVSELTKFQAFYELAVAMTANRSLDENLLLVVTTAMDLLSGDASYIALRDDEDRSVYMHTACGTHTEEFKKIRVPYGSGVGGRVASSGRPYIVEDYFRETEPLLHDVVRAEGLVSGVAVPVQMGGVNLGVLYVFNRTRTTFTQSDVNTLSLLGNLAAVEIRRDQTSAELRSARDELEDRVRIRTDELLETSRQLKVETILRESLEEKTIELRRANERLMLEISQRRKAQEALREGEEKFRRLYIESVRAQELYRSLLDSCADAIVVYDMEGRVKYVSDSFTAMFGWTLDELSGKQIDYVPDSEKEPTIRQISQVLEKGIPGSGFETKRLTRDGRVIDASLSASRYHDHDGKPAGLLVILRDITTRKQSEQSLAQSERQLRLLSAQLLTAQENERKRVARELHDGIGQLLTATKFRLESLQRRTEFAETSSAHEMIAPIIKVIQDSIEEVRRISMALRPSILDDLGIGATINWFCREFSSTFSEVKITRSIDLNEDSLPQTLKTVIFRVIQESLNNVAKHSNADTVHIKLCNDAESVFLSISDNGAGISIQEWPLVRGGFGMAGMRERVESLGGVFTVESQAGKGTSVSARWSVNQP